jgi:hypothetical protein
VSEPSFVGGSYRPAPYVPPYFPLVHYVRELPIVIGNLKPATQEEIDRDLAPLSPTECARRGLVHSSEDYAVNELIELPAPEYRRNVLVAAAERRTGMRESA